MAKLSTYRIVILAIMVLATGTLNAQKPLSQSRVPAAAIQPATAPAAYPSTAPVNFVRSWQPRQPYDNIEEVISEQRSVAEVNRSTQYIDGLGRPLQAVGWRSSPSQTDIVAPVVYDAFGREQYKYLPYSEGADGGFKTDPFGRQQAFYTGSYAAEQPALGGENFFYSHTQYEASPLNRVNKTFAPGNSWAGTEGTADETAIRIEYLINTNADQVQIWEIGFGADFDSNIPISTRQYEAGQLYKTVTTDEAGHAVAEYKDKEGQVVLKKVQSTTSPSGDGGWLSTYYVYDDLGQLRFVLPPKAVVQYLQSQTLSTTVINELCFRYEYDERNRMIGKKVPGAGWVYMVYDKRDRLVFAQDANLRTGGGHWLYTLYDALNRPVQTGIMSGYTGSRVDLQAWVNGLQSNVSELPTGGSAPNPVPPVLVISEWEPGRKIYQAEKQIVFEDGFASPSGDEFKTIIGPGTPATFSGSQQVQDNPLPPGITHTALTLSYYDNYSFTQKTYTPNHNDKLDIGQNPYGEPMPTAQNNAIQGLPTGSRVRVLETTEIAALQRAPWLETASFYDEKGRMVQVQSDNYKGGSDVATTRYNFGGQAISAYTLHSNPQGGVDNLGVKTNMNYDHAGRLQSIQKQVGADAPRNIVRNTYDVLGQLKNKQTGQKTATEPLAMENDEYAYNIRGWLKGMNWQYGQGDKTSPTQSRDAGKWFSMDLSYDWGYSQSQHNGNIAGQRWATAGDGEERSYGYRYDAANRLLKGEFVQYDGTTWNNTAKSGANINFSMQMGDGQTAATAYDENGNILTMQQMGLKLKSSSQIDQLSYGYNPTSNKLSSVTDSITADQKLGDFTDKNTQGNDYAYDSSGNMVEDKNKNIQSIAYNHLNLPAKITVKDKGTITYLYDAAGNKLEKIVDETAPATKKTKTTYLGGYVYENNTLKFFGHEEGRVRKKIDAQAKKVSYVYDYFIKDHLGNTRVVLTEEQQTDAYPVASMETAEAEKEKLLYSNIDETRAPKPAGYPDDKFTNPNGYVSKLNGNGQKIGPGIVLKVMAGDKFNIRANSWYRSNGANPESPANPLNELVAALAGGVAKTMSGKYAATELVSGNILSPGLGEMLNNQTASTTKPKAGLYWVLFDEQFGYVGNSSGNDFVGSDQEFKQHIVSEAVVNKNGYLYIYVSNETPNIDVFFDNLQVSHVRGSLLEETHYYPFGLTMAGISSKAAGKVENRFKFNGGTELERGEFSDGSGLDLYSTEFRSYDAQIGRFHQIDPLAEFTFNWSGYTFVQNNPILFNDPLGLDTLKRNADGVLPTTRADGSMLQDVDVVLGENGQVANYYNGESWQAPKELENVTVTSSPKKKEDPQTQTPWMDKAESQLGVVEDKRPGKSNPEVIKYHLTTGKFKDDAVPWCASFTNWCLVQSNISSLNSARAFDYKNFGVKLNQPAYGAIAIMNYSHVGFVAGQNSDGRIVILGGNQGDAVNYSPNAVSAVLQYRYPKGFKPNYNLPAFKLRGRSLTGSTSR